MKDIQLSCGSVRALTPEDIDLLRSISCIPTYINTLHTHVTPFPGPGTCLNVHHSHNHYGYASYIPIIVYAITKELFPTCVADTHVC
jgi:hypothetical protein